MITRRLQFLTKVAVIIGAFLLFVIVYKNSVAEGDSESYSASGLSVQFIENDEVNKNDLFNLKSFRHRITPSRECKSFQNEKLAVMLVMSYVGHDDLRASHRQALSENSLNALGIARYFLLADIPPTERYISQSQIDDESSRFGDILQGGFNDAYRNLTYKHMMGLKWAAENCDSFKFVIKVDDDIVFDVFKLKEYMEKGIHSGKFIAGFVLDNQKVVRNQQSKWYVKEEEFHMSVYPSYLSGWLYITTPATALDLYKNSHGTDFFWIDDILITGVIREKSRVMTIRINDWFSPNAEFMKCCVRDLQKHFYECDYSIGPNGGDNKMLKDFIEGSKMCHQGKCFQRPLENSLHKTCVAEVHEIFRDHGDPIVTDFKLK